MLSLNRTEQIQIRILIAIVMLSGIFYLSFAPKRIFLKDAVIKGSNHAEISISDDGTNVEILEVEQKGKISPSKVIINDSSLEDLMCCPGIGRQKALAIIEERKISPFYSWKNFQRRIKSISPIQIQILKDAGVRIDSSEQEITDL